MEGHNDAEYFRTLEAANAGKVEAMYKLSRMFHDGSGGAPQSYDRWAQWCRKAANYGHSKAQHDLGVSYMSGARVKPSFTTAIAWFQAAVASDPENCEASCLQLGELYELGCGQPVDLELAKFWYDKTTYTESRNRIRRLLKLSPLPVDAE